MSTSPQPDLQKAPLPDFPSKESLEAYLGGCPSAWKIYSELPLNLKQELIDFCTGKHGLKVTYDPVFKQIFNPILHHDRLEALLTAILGRPLRIVKVIPREGTQLNEQTSFVVMDVLIQLDDGSFANVEMQKIGYNFPLARADCYASDIIMRQYAQAKLEQGQAFSFQNLHKVYCIILMEKSPQEFHSVKDKYIHRRISSFDTNIYQNSSGLHEDIFICLDSFHSIVHNITKDSTGLEAWLTFLSTTDVETITELIDVFPHFADIYQEIADFVRKPEELMNMLSEALYIMDKNMERMMVTELQEEVSVLKAEKESVRVALENANIELETVNAELETVNAELETVNAELETVNAELKTVNVELETTEAKLQRVLDFAKAHGYQEQL